MAWITLTAAHLKGKISDAEYGSVTAASLATGQTAAAIVEEELESTTVMVRGYVSGFRGNVLGEAGTIPDEVKDAALCIMRHKVFTRVPGLKRLLDEGRVREYEDAIKLLRDVAAGRFRIVGPTTAAPTEEQAGGGTVSVITKRPIGRESRDSLGGLL